MSDNGGNGKKPTGRPPGKPDLEAYKKHLQSPIIDNKSFLAPLSPLKKQIFLDTLRRTGNATEAARCAGYSRRHIYSIREMDPEFAAEWDSIKQEYLDWLESVCDERATRDDKPSDLLMMFRLKGERPLKYRDNINVSHRHDHFVNLDIRQLITIAQLGVDDDHQMLIEGQEGQPANIIEAEITEEE